jgi:hypothetical protein
MRVGLPYKQQDECDTEKGFGFDGRVHGVTRWSNFSRVLKKVMSAGKTRQNPTKKRSLCVINKLFDEDFNTALSSAIVFQQPVRS